MNFKHTRSLAGLALTFALLGGSVAVAATAPSLGTAESFAVLAGTTVTNTGSSLITGDLGVSPGSAITGFPPGTLIGTMHAADAVALQAQSDLTTAYNDLAGQACNTDLTGQDLGGMTLIPGAYCFSSSAQLTGTLTLDAQGSSTAVFVFQIGSTLTTATNASVLLINSGDACNVFWQIGSSATLGTGTAFAGNILALTSITLDTGANMTGRALARNGAVTLDTNNVDATCLAACPTITLSPITLPNGNLGVPYSQPITAGGGAAPYTFAVTAGFLPPGILLTPSGPSSALLSGTPTASGTFNFTITATDFNNCPGSQDYTIVINLAPCPTITVSPTTLPAPTLNIFYSQLISASGGTGSYIFTVTAGALPPNLTLSPLTSTPSVVLSGTVVAPGTYNFTITATDANGCPGSQAYTMIVASQVGSAEGIPTLSEWALIIFGALMAFAGVVALRWLA